MIETGVSDAANLAGSWLSEKIVSRRIREASMSLCFDRLTAATVISAVLRPSLVGCQRRCVDLSNVRTLYAFTIRMPLHMHQRQAQRIEYGSRLRRFFYLVHRVQVMRRRIRARRYFGREVTGLRHRPQVGISQDNLDLAELALILAGLGLVSQRVVFRAQFLRFGDCAIDVVTFTEKSSTRAVDEETKFTVPAKGSSLVAFCARLPSSFESFA